MRNVFILVIALNAAERGPIEREAPCRNIYVTCVYVDSVQHVISVLGPEDPVAVRFMPECTVGVENGPRCRLLASRIQLDGFELALLVTVLPAEITVVPQVMWPFSIQEVFKSAILILCPVSVTVFYARDQSIVWETSGKVRRIGRKVRVAYVVNRICVVFTTVMFPKVLVNRCDGVFHTATVEPDVELRGLAV